MTGQRGNTGSLGDRTSPGNTASLRPDELEAVYAISKVVSVAEDIDTAMDEITALTRAVFIFDSAVLYRLQDGPEPLEPAFARVVGRGRSAPADLAWGERAAREALESGQMYRYETDPKPDADRLDQHFYLSLPMIAAGRTIGVLVFIRFGGPSYTEEQVNLAQFIATHVSQLFERQLLVERVANLEAERRLARLQDEFIAMVSHELLTPLGFIKGYTTTLLRKDTAWDEKTLSEFLNIIDEETDRLSELIENLLDSSRLQSGTLRIDLKPVRLSDLLGDILSRTQTRYNGLILTADLHAADLTVHVDAKRIGQVFDNLIANAVKYAAGASLSLSARRAGEAAVVCLRDDGPGIAPEHLPNLFKRFYRVPERSAGVRGTGLGLFICERIIETHGGEISVQSQPGEGTEFIIRLPLGDALPEVSEEGHV
ncbi:MAG: GAF domain-containing protein [Anaerolineae bacterium]|nr:MAG: GAF domain-containing protein [Anaerolineae bacterium]